MPLYEYRCRACDHEFELLQRLGDGVRGVRCPECEAARVEKLHSTFAGHSSGAGSGADGACSPARAIGESCGAGFT